MHAEKWVLACLLMLCSFNITANSSWQLYQESQNIRIEYQRKPDNLLLIRASITVRSNMGAFLYLLEDTANISSWLANSNNATVLAKPDQYTHIVHTQFRAVWPVSPRDIITRSVWEQDPKTKVLTLDVTDMGQQYAENKGYVRMQHVSGQWTLTPLPEGKLRIAYQGQADPAGRLPHFLSHSVALKAILNTFEKLPKVLLNYQQAYPNIIE